MRNASSQRWTRRYKFTARRRERRRECSRVHQYNSYSRAVVYEWYEWRSAAPLSVVLFSSIFFKHLLYLGCFAFFPRNETKRNEKGNRTTLYFLDALFKDAEDGKTNARMNAEIKRERERESYFLSLSRNSFFFCRLSLHLFTFWLHDLYAYARIAVSFSHAHTKRHKGKI